MMATKAHVRPPFNLKEMRGAWLSLSKYSFYKPRLTRFLLRYKVNIMRSVGSFSQFFHS